MTLRITTHTIRLDVVYAEYRNQAHNAEWRYAGYHYSGRRDSKLCTLFGLLTWEYSVSCTLIKVGNIRLYIIFFF
jgi:hypothetical protein